MRVREIGRFARSTIYVTERGVEILREDGSETPPAPTQEQVREARQAIAEALATLHGERKEYLSRDILTLDYLWGMKGALEEILRAAFDALDTPAEGTPDGAGKGGTPDHHRPEALAAPAECGKAKEDG